MPWSQSILPMFAFIITACVACLYLVLCAHNLGNCRACGCTIIYFLGRMTGIAKGVMNETKQSRICTNNINLRDGVT